MKEFNFYLVSYLPKNIKNEITKIARVVADKFDTHTFINSWEPHLTVWSWLFVPENKLTELIDDLQDITYQLNKTKINIKGIGYIDNLNNLIAKNPYVIFLNIILTNKLQLIFDTFEKYQKFRKKWYAIKKYSPHVTLAYDDLIKENFEKAIDFLINNNSKYEFILDNFSIVSYNEKTNRWEEFKKFEFWR